MSVSIRRLYELYGRFGKIHFLTDLPLNSAGDDEEDFRVYRYMQYPDLVLSLENRNFAFMTPNCWEDKLERRFWNTDYSALNPHFQKPEFACLCVAAEKYENIAALWKMYRKETHEKKPGDFDNNLVRLSIRLAAFWEELDNWAKENDSEIYVAAIDYSYGQEQIKNELQYDERVFPRGFDIEDYFRALSIKRPYFAFEREIRVFALQPNRKGAKKIDKSLLIMEPFDITKFITNILVSPCKEGYQRILKAEDIRPVMRHFFPDKENMGDFVKQSKQFDGRECKSIPRPEKENAMAENKKATALNKNSSHRIEGTIEDVSIVFPDGEPPKVSIKITGSSAYTTKDGKYNLYKIFPEPGRKDQPETLDEDETFETVKAEERVALTCDGANSFLLDLVRDALSNKKTVEIEVGQSNQANCKFAVTALTIKK